MLRVRFEWWLLSMTLLSDPPSPPGVVLARGTRTAGSGVARAVRGPDGHVRGGVERLSGVVLL